MNQQHILDRDQCEKCLRVIDPHDQDAQYKFNTIVACGSCTPSRLNPNPPPKKRRSTSLLAANRYCQRFGGRIIGGSIDKPLRLLRANGKGNLFFVAEIPPLFSRRGGAA